jgi:hypothetical protein
MYRERPPEDIRGSPQTVLCMTWARGLFTLIELPAGSRYLGPVQQSRNGLRGFGFGSCCCLPSCLSQRARGSFLGEPDIAIVIRQILCRR